MQQYGQILVGVGLQKSEAGATPSLSADCCDAVRRAIELAAIDGAQLTFSHTFAVSPGMREGLFSHEQEGDSPVAQARAALDPLVDQAKAAGVTAKVELLVGKPWVEIPDFAHKSSTDLIIMGSRQQKGIKRALFGSTANRVMLAANCPVLIVQSEGRASYEHIVIATDLTPAGKRVLEHGIGFARRHKASCDVVHGVENWYENQWDRAGYAREAIEREHKKEKELATAKLQQEVRELVGDSGLQVNVTVVTGTPEGTIWETATEKPTDLVVMGVVGRTGFDRWWVGDTAQRILPELPCSLLAVKAAPE